MIAADAERQLSMHTTLTEYAVYDASLLVSEFARESLLKVYTEASSIPSHPHVHRALAVRLVSKGGGLGSRFMWLMLKDFRDLHVQDRLRAEPTLEDMAVVQKLGAAVRRECHEPIGVLASLLAQEDRGFVMAQSPLAPERYAHNLNLALQMQEFSAQERSMMLNAWAGEAFVRTMSLSYHRYISVLNSWSAVTLQAHQDFVDTWPMQALGARAAL